MASPSLKITLKLSGTRPIDIPQPSPTSSTTSSLKNVNVKEEDVSSSESPRKKPKPNNNRSRKPKLEGTPIPDTPITVDDENVEENSNNNNKRSGGSGPGSGAQNNVNTNSINLKELLKFKDVKVRKWETKPLVFYTLDGKEIKIPSWQSEESMKLNEQSSEPITVAEIDQLFSSTGGEKDFRPFLCTQPGCSKAFTTFDQLQTHETNMHGTKKLVCGIEGCHKSFVTTGQLTKHRKMVHFRAARKAKLAAAAATPNSEALGDGIDKEEEDATPSAMNGGDTDSVDISNS